MVTAGDVLWWMHKFRRPILSIQAIGIIVGVLSMIVRNWGHLVRLIH
ncbi:hypothetical protein [Brevundimonas naejangsanensis]|nr:hypothetical protein [Brevundimonas naejangsanensis]